ncbi:hypothetical protein AGMMS49545_00020 [Betaproteobacteria bacterium]|nr:hypothetical protein AGMMS49545_00020 [Betaproteobacteria bacterium]GHU48215.1 hypothetical protein AGMMS50289_24530 [Betaproteobacteria bacterium]
MGMQERRFELKFLTPAFLGDAEQNGVWRTPPIKALLRQWWRVAYAARHGFDVAAMREAEGILFGHADGNTANGRAAARRSVVRLRLDQWEEGKLAKAKWVAGDKIPHPEVGKIDSFLYLGYGHLKGASLNKANAAIQASESAQFRLAYPEEYANLLEQALWLMDRFGTLGGRSRNGWGSFTLKPQDGDALQGKLPLRKWQECLTLDWPHAIGKDNNDNNALIWQTTPFNDWKQAMTELARLKIELRTKFSFKEGNQRLWLSYPVTHHNAFGGALRLPNSLRFKLRPTPDGKLVGVIFHVPCKPPSDFKPNIEQIKEVWKSVHEFLNTNSGLRRIQE